MPHLYLIARPGNMGLSEILRTSLLSELTSKWPGKPSQNVIEGPVRRAVIIQWHILMIFVQIVITRTTVISDRCPHPQPMSAAVTQAPE